MFKLIILLLASFAIVADSINCFQFNSYENRQTVVHGQKFCMAHYEISTGESSFSGGIHNPHKKHHGTKDCQIETHGLGGEESQYYACICYTELCNFPFSFFEFEKRGHTLDVLIQ